MSDRSDRVFVSTVKLTTDKRARKNAPVATGVLDYFPLAVVAVAEVSHVGSEQHNPGEPLHWARSKGGDNADALARHLLERGTIDADGMRHSAKVAWRALAILQIELEEAQRQAALDAQVQKTIDSMSAPKCARDGDCDVMAGPAPGTRAPNVAMACGFCGSLEHEICGTRGGPVPETLGKLKKPLY